MYTKKTQIAIIIVITILLGSTTTYAQLGTPLAQYSGNQMVYNPAYAGIYDMLSINTSVRKLWIGLPGSPSLISLNGHMPFSNQRHAMGLVFQREQWGALTAHYGYVNYAHKMYFDRSLLNFGVQAGFLNNITDWDLIEYVRDWDDPALGQGKTSGTHFDVNAGVYYQAPLFYVGLSAKHLMRPKYDFLTSPVTGEVWYSQRSMQFFLIGGYYFQLSDEWSLRPEFLVRYAPTAPTGCNAGAQFGYKNNHFIGVNWQTGQRAVSFTAKSSITPELRVGYSYDVYYGAIRPFQKGSHELSVNYLVNSFWKKGRTARLLWL
jgi:type IX secretion system PorP/SprF family membrane protein